MSLCTSVRSPLAALTFQLLKRSSVIGCRYYCSTTDNLSVIRSERVKVQPHFGHIHLKGNVNYVVTPDMDHQCGTVVSVRLLGPSEGPEAGLSVTQRTDSSIELTGYCQGASHQHRCEVMLPVKYDVSAELSEDASISLQGLQNETIQVKTQSGHLSLDKLQSLNTSFSTVSGAVNIKNKLLSSLSCQGLESLTILGGCLQSGAVDISSPEVEVQLDSIHSNTLHLSSERASLKIKDITSQSTLRVTHAVQANIGNCSGHLDWEIKDGTLMMGVPQLVQSSSIAIDEGVCSIACPAEYRYSISAAAQHLTVRPGFSDVRRSVSSSKGSGSSLQVAESSGPESSATLSVRVTKGRLILTPWSWPFTDHDLS